MKKILCLSLLFLAGCASYEETGSIRLSEPVKTVSVEKIIAADSATSQLFEKIIRDKLLANGIIVKDKSLVTISGIVTHSTLGIIESAVFTIKIDDKIVKDIRFNQNAEWVFAYKTPLEIADDISNKTVNILRQKTDFRQKTGFGFDGLRSW